MKTSTQLITLGSIALLASCSNTEQSNTSIPEVKTNAPSATSTPKVISTSTSTTGKDTVKGVNKTVSGINKIGNTVRSVRLISGLF